MAYSLDPGESSQNLTITAEHLCDCSLEFGLGLGQRQAVRLLAGDT
jgi:hypothetical protein